MHTQEIVTKLHTSKYLYTDAHKIRDEVKKLDAEDCEQIISEIHGQMGMTENFRIKRALAEVIQGLKKERD